MCNFPNIQFVNDFAPLQGGIVNIIPPSPRAMFTNLLHKGIIDNRFLEGIHNMAELELAIFELIDHYPENNASLERIFHLIQIWGGRMGKGIYNLQEFHWDDIEPIYKPFIDEFRTLTAINEATLGEAERAVENYYYSLRSINYRGMGVAFITKHSRFWMHRNLPDMMLPIYDSTFSYNVMQRGRSANLKDLPDYWNAMVAKARQEGVSLTSMERQLFNYFITL